MLALGGSLDGLGRHNCRVGLRSTRLGRLHGLDQRELGRFEVGQLRSKRCCFDEELLGLVGQADRTAPDPVAFFTRPIRCGAQCRQFTPDLGRGTRGSGHAAGPLLFELGALSGEQRLGLCELFGERCEPLRFALHLGEFRGETCRLGLEGRNDALVDRGTPESVETATTLGEDRRQTPGLLEERFIGRQAVAEVVTPHRRQFCLDGHDLGVEFGQRTAEPLLLAGEFGPVAHAVLETRAKALQLSSGDEDPQGRQFGDHAGMPPCGVGLTFEGTQLSSNLPEEILQSGEIALGRGESTLGLLLATSVLEDPCSLLDDRPSLLRSCIEDRVDLSLRDDHVLLSTDTAVRQQILDVEEPTRHTIERVLAVAGAEQGPGDGDLVELDREHPRRVVDGETDLGASERRPLCRAGEDDIVHLLGSDGGRGLGAEDPSDRVDHVGLAAAIGADDDGDAGFEVECCRIGEGLEALHRESFQIHQT